MPERRRGFRVTLSHSRKRKPRKQGARPRGEACARPGAEALPGLPRPGRHSRRASRLGNLSCTRPRAEALPGPPSPRPAQPSRERSPSAGLSRGALRVARRRQRLTAGLLRYTSADAP
jgi:hypothetical protein